MFFIFSPPYKKIEILPITQLAHLQAAQADTQTQACKRANSPTRHITTMTVLKAKKSHLNRQKLN
jgi:hypothetical protein